MSYLSRKLREREFVDLTKELLDSEPVRMMGQWKHHGPVTTLDHSLFVAFSTYRVARMLRPVAEEKGVELLIVSITGAVVLATEGELHQILYNLAENAIKYNRPGGRVRVTAEPGEESTILTVEDNGIGIPAEDLSNVFKRFYRVDKARSRAAGGTGLGLSIVSDTVSRRGGAIRAENVEGGGTRFIVTLPSMERGEEEL